MKKHLMMMMVAFSVSATLLVACKGQKTNAAGNVCNSQAKVIRTANNETGTFMRDQVSGRYAIRVITPQTIDEQNVYLICNPPSQLPKENSTVSFSGTVRTSSQVSNLGGLTYYDLEASSVK